MLVSSLAYSSTLNIKACSPKTSVDFQRTTRRYIPEEKKSSSIRVLQLCKQDLYALLGEILCFMVTSSAKGLMNVAAVFPL
jgi:hypothetical protein